MPSLVRKPAAACASAAGGTASLPQRGENDHLFSRKSSPGTKQSAAWTHLGEPKDDGGGNERVNERVAASRKRKADQLGEEIDLEETSASTRKPSIGSAAAAAHGASRPRKKKAPLVDWRVQRIVRDLGRLDVLRRGDVGPDVVSEDEDEDEDETALDILVCKLVEDADEGGHMPPAPDEDVEYDDIWDDDDDGGDDYAGGAVAVDHPFENDGDAFMPAAPPGHFHGEDANSIAVVTQNGDESLTNMADASDDESNDDGVASGDEADVVDLVSTDDEDHSEEHAAGRQVHAAASAKAELSNSAELSMADVNYNHGARNPLNDPTARPVYRPGDDAVLGPLRSLLHRQLEWFAATSKDVADRKGIKNAPIVLVGQVGVRCVHCAHIPFTKRTVSATIYPTSYNGMNYVSRSYKSKHFMLCKEVPSNIKTFSQGLSSDRGKRHREYLMNGLQSIGIIEEDGRLVFGNSRPSVVDERMDVIGSDGSEEGYWLCDKCQSVKFANFDEACRHEESCHGVRATPDVTGLNRSDSLLHRPDTSDSTSQGGRAYELSLCCECGEVEDPSSDVPMLLCDGCDSAIHLTCTKDIPKLTEVPGGEWFCSNCALVNRFKEKRLSEDRAITAAFTAVGAVLDDNFCTTPNEGTKRRARPKLGRNLDAMFEGIPETQTKFLPMQPGKKRVRCCVVMGCTRAGLTTRRYMCLAHFARARLLEKIQTMPDGVRRFPCTAKDPSLPRDHDRAYVAVPPKAKRGTQVKCSNVACQKRGHYRYYGENFRYCAFCDIIIQKLSFTRRHKHDDEFALEENEKRANMDTSHQTADEVNAEDDEIVYGFDSIRSHTKDRKRKGEYLFRVKWKNGEITSEPDTYLKEDDPATFVAYLKNSGLAKTKKYVWANEEEHV